MMMMALLCQKLKNLVALAKKILKTLPLYFYVKHWLGSTRVLVLSGGGWGYNLNILTRDQHALKVRVS